MGRCLIHYTPIVILFSIFLILVTFSHPLLANDPPVEPVLLSPAAGATGVDLDDPAGFFLKWSCSDPDIGDVLTYDVYLGEDPDPSWFASTSHTPPSPGSDETWYQLPLRLKGHTTYYWRIVARDNQGHTTEGTEIRQFTTRNAPPKPVTLVFPTANADILPGTIWLRWACDGDPDPNDTISYDVYFGTQANDPTPIDNTENTHYERTLSANKTYYWEIKAKDGLGEETASGRFSFTTHLTQTLHDDETIDTTGVTFLKTDSPHVIKGTLTITDDGELTIEPGTVVKFEPNALIKATGELKAVGTPAEPIVFTSGRDDLYLGNTGTGSPVPEKGDWQRIEFNSGDSDSSKLEYCVLRYGGTSIGAVYVSESNPSIRFNTITRCGSYGIKIFTGAPNIAGNTFSENENFDLFYYHPADSNPPNTYEFGICYQNSLKNSLKIHNGFLQDFSDNTLHYNGSFPIKIPAQALQGFSGNTFTGYTAASIIEVTGGRVIGLSSSLPGFTYHILADLFVEISNNESKLSIDPGATLKFANNTGLFAGREGYGYLSTLAAQGTAESKITFTTLDDNPATRSWTGIVLGNRSKDYNPSLDTGTVLEHCDVLYAGGDGTLEAAGIHLTNTFPGLSFVSVNHSKGSGIWVDNQTATVPVQILESAITECEDCGIVLDAASTGTIQVHQSVIQDNGAATGADGCGISNETRNTTPVTIDAHSNFWGHASGPYHSTTNPGGQGNLVTDHVDFEPWMSTLTGTPLTFPGIILLLGVE